MPPSPTLRCSPRTELRVANHKRGRSLEGGLLFRGKDDDLALFNEMQNKERDDFLLQSSDDFEDTFSTKLRHFSDNKLGISIPTRIEGNDLLNADGAKNDYAWLVTPPDTPLFPSLDDEPAPASVARRGRPRSQPISISRSSTMEKSYRSSRGSASPNRLSPSPRSGTSTFQSRGRPSSTSSQQHVPLRKPSPPPSKPSTPGPRSTTPTPRRMSTGSSGSVTSSSVKGISHVKTSRGSSASPKVSAWQTNIPGFSTDAPPNLRTSLADRPASYVRGSMKVGRQSMSPTASRSISSSHSHDQERFGSQSKGSVASSGDDDVDSLQSIPMSSDLSGPKRVGPFPKSFPKNSARVLSPSSAPKRSFDSALRQMDHRKSPQNMFRPLLSSVPSTTFYVGKSSSSHRSLISRNSLVTSSSNASSDQGASASHNTEEHDHNQDDIASGFGKVSCPDIQEEVFAFDKADTVNENVQHDIQDHSLKICLDDLDGSPTIEFDPDASEDLDNHDTDLETSAASDMLYVKGDFSEVDSHENMEICSECGCMYRTIEPEESYIKLCLDCSRKHKFVTVASPDTTVVLIESSQIPYAKILEESKPIEQPMMLSEPPEVTDMGEQKVSPHEEYVKQIQNPLVDQTQNVSGSNYLASSLMERGEQRLHTQQDVAQLTFIHSLSDNGSGVQQLEHFDGYSDLKVDISDGSGISLLLKRSSSSKGPVVQGRTFTATTISYDDPSYARGSANSMRSSFGHGSASTSSSVDISSGRQIETHVQRQLSGSYKNEISSKSQSIGSSLSGVSSQNYLALGPAARTYEENSEASICIRGHDVVEEMSVTSQEQVLASEISETGGINKLSSKTENPEEDKFERNKSIRTLDASASELLSPAVSIWLEEKSGASFSNYIETDSFENVEDFSSNRKSVSDVEASTTRAMASFEKEHSMRNTNADALDVAELTALRSLVSLSDIEIENHIKSSLSSQIDDVSPKSKRVMGELQEPSVTTHLVKDSVGSNAEAMTSDNTHGLLEESPVLLEGRGGSNARSLTLEEATATILFCSSLVHDLAYQAATIAMEKESPIPVEYSRPMVTILGKSNTDRNETCGRPVGKRTSKSQKARQRRIETDAKPSMKTENDENMEESFPCNVGLPNKVDSLKPPKLESKCNCTIM